MSLQGQAVVRSNIPDHVQSGDEDLDLPFPPNPGIGQFVQSSEDESSNSDDGEGTAEQQCNYVDLHALHEYRAGPRQPSTRSGGAVLASTDGLRSGLSYRTC
jgi:hypothetical protein